VRFLIDKISIRASTQELTGALFLVAVGGYGDAASFLLVRCFTGHTTGNSVLAAIALATGEHLWEPILAVFCFLCATAFALRLRSSSTRPFGSKGFQYVLAAEIVLIFFSPYMLVAQHRFAFIGCMSLALGLQNGALSKADGINLHTTYLTGTLTHLVSVLVQPTSAGALGANSEARFIPLVWAAFVGGALCGGLMISRAGPRGVWGMPVLLVVVLAISLLSPVLNPDARE
jgi:uncharacterized membrane protein YoaK (UPF0700 family)